MSLRRIVILFVVALALLYFMLWNVVANPLQLFVPRSEGFTFDRFNSIQPGSSIESAIGLLGKPVQVIRDDTHDLSCPSCTHYCFMGNPPDWVVGFKEAWLIVDAQGRIVRKFVNTEP